MGLWKGGCINGGGFGNLDGRLVGMWPKGLLLGIMSGGVMSK